MSDIKRKLRLLWVGEASYLHTGYASYSKAVLQRLYDTGKYDIAELACYGSHDDGRRFDLPWVYYPNLPISQEEGQLYGSNPINAFGAWRFEDVVLHFKPDVVASARDHWMDSFIEQSPLRPYFLWATMPTVDSCPQMEGWISTYMTADTVFTYSQFGEDVLVNQSGGKIKVEGHAPMGIDPNAMYPSPNKEEHKARFGLPAKSIVVGTVMRNQKRKLFPDLIDSFDEFCKLNPDLTNVYLYLHTSYPDVGWDIPRLIRESAVGHRIYLTYICENCGHITAMPFSDSKTSCVSCGQHAAVLPNVKLGVPPDRLLDIYNLFDLYVQYSICEGFGGPQIEAAACGVPVMAVDYSAMSNVVRNVGGTPIRVQRLFRESETHTYRAYPDNADFVDKLTKFCKLPPSLRAKKGRDALLGVRKHYTWDKVASVWDRYLSKVVPKDIWNSPPNFFSPTLNVPANLDNDTLIQWGFHNILGKPELLNSFMALRMVRDLNYGIAVRGYGGPYYNEESATSMNAQHAPFSKEDAMNQLLAIREGINYWEQVRTGEVKVDTPIVVKYHKPDDRS